MKPIILIIMLVLGGTGLWAVSGGETMALEDEYVVIDGHEGAYTVFIRVPKASLEKIQASAGQEKLDVERWARFQTEVDRYVRRCIIKNEYPQYSEQNIKKGLLAFLNAYPGMPIGLTWNGGIAMTYGDYEHAKNIMQKYRTDKDQYERLRHTDPKADPLNPRAHLEALLGDSFIQVE